MGAFFTTLSEEQNAMCCINQRTKSYANNSKPNPTEYNEAYELYMESVMINLETEECLPEPRGALRNELSYTWPL